MTKISVYSFEYFDRSTQTWTIAPDMATEQAILSIGARIIVGSRVEVDIGRIGHAGIVMRHMG